MSAGSKNYEIGYGRPPKSGRFRKGTSGNPSGRPKKPSDGNAEWQKELNSKLIINENGKRKVITKSVGIKRQLANKAVSGSIQAARLVLNWERKAEEKKAAEPQRDSPNYPDGNRTPTAKDLSDDDLAAIIRAANIEKPKQDRANGRKPANRRKTGV
jgi:hypothetical protein